jgi:glucose-6-phosphate isomerase
MGKGNGERDPTRVTTTRRTGGGADSEAGPGIDLILTAELEQAVNTRLEQAVAENVVARLWERDTSLWGGPGLAEMENRLGWLDSAEEMRRHLDELTALRDELRCEGYTDAVLLGMGGSSLGAEVIRRSFGERAEGLRLQVLDSTHPDAIDAVDRSLTIEKTMFIVSSKSGATIETLSLYAYFLARATPAQFIVITDPGSPLAARAERDAVRRTFLNPSDIGGRYSVLSYFGLVPAALAGVPIDALLRRCQAAQDACSPASSVEANLGLRIGVAIGELALRGRDKLTFAVSEPIDSFGQWVEQLVAESTGKRGSGILPIVDEPIGAPNQYGSDRAFVYMRHGNQPSAGLDLSFEALTAAGQPIIRQVTFNAAGLGRLFFVFQFAIAIAGWVLGINPFDQPDVRGAKDDTNRILESGSLPTIELASDTALRALLGAEPPHYVAILGYLPTTGPQSAGIDDAVAELRAVIREATGMATTWGYGPRFQHSTGQEHLGGPPNGRFVQLVNVPRARVAIPGEGYDFTTLTAAAAPTGYRLSGSSSRDVQLMRCAPSPNGCTRSSTAGVSALR